MEELLQRPTDRKGIIWMGRRSMSKLWAQLHPSAATWTNFKNVAETFHYNRNLWNFGSKSSEAFKCARQQREATNARQSDSLVPFRFSSPRLCLHSDDKMTASSWEVTEYTLSGPGLGVGDVHRYMHRLDDVLQLSKIKYIFLWGEKYCRLSSYMGAWIVLANNQARCMLNLHFLEDSDISQQVCSYTLNLPQ